MWSYCENHKNKLQSSVKSVRGNKVVFTKAEISQRTSIRRQLASYIRSARLTDKGNRLKVKVSDS